MPQFGFYKNQHHYFTATFDTAVLNEMLAHQALRTAMKNQILALRFLGED